MTAILQPGPAMDFGSNLFGWTSDALADLGEMESLAALFPDPPNQPPPDSHGPPILSSNEVSQFTSHIEALTSKYKHTANWRDPPRKNQNQFGHRRASTTQLGDFGSLEAPYSIDQYHGTLNGLLSSWPNHAGHPHGAAFASTVAPHQLQNAPAPNAHRRTHSESTIDSANVLETLGINVPEMKHFIGSILSASHPSFSAPFFTDQIAPQDQAALLPAELTSLTGTGEITTASSSPYAVQNPTPVTFGSDLSFKSPHFNAPNNVPNMERNFEQRTLDHYGLEPEPSASASPISMSMDEQGLMSPSLKRKSFSMADDSIDMGSKRKRLSISIEGPYTADKRKSPSLSPMRDGMSPRSKSHGARSPVGDKRRGKKGSPRPRLSETQKKENHKASEAKRRERVVIAQNRLWSLLPEVSGKPSQRMRLEQTMDHMRCIKAGNETLRMQLMQIQCA